MLSPDVEITKQLEDARYARDGSIERYIRLEYFVGKHGPFRLEVSRADVDNGRRDELVNADALKFRTG